MRRTLAVLVIATLALANPTAWAAAGAKRVIITFKSGTTQAQRAKALVGLKARSVGAIVSNGNSDEEFVAEVAEVADVMSLPSPSAGQEGPAAAGVVKIEDDYKAKWIESSPVAFQTTPFLTGASLGALGLQKFAPSARGQGAFTALAGPRPEIPWGVSRVKAPAAWDTTEGAGVRVAVIDTGIDTTHPDLEGKVDGGYSAIADSEKPDSYQDDNGHGTHVSGTIAALKNGKGVVGVAPKARLYAVKVLDAEGSGSLSDVIRGIIWCANNGMQVANMSLGSSTPSDAMQRALKYAKARGVVVVAAAGNSGPKGGVGYPAAYPETIAVAASDWEDNVAKFSSRGPEVKFIAPGVAVVSTAMGGGFANFSGTSMATPHVTGLAALAVSQGYVGLDGPDGVFAQLKKAAKPIEGLQATDQGFGMIDAGKLAR